MNPYDEVPYESRAVPLSSIDRIALHARLHGLETAAPDACRVLELGCAEGANLLAMAFYLDESTFVGVDASRVQIDRGIEARDRLGLDNLELRCATFADVAEEEGEYDYIIVHGVLSWIDAPGRALLLDTVRKRLAPKGVAYLSYNCSAGWSPKTEVRRLLLDRAGGVEDPTERVLRVRELLTLLASSPLRETTSYGAMLAEHAASALDHRDSYLVHEYLSPHNHAFEYRELLELTRAHGLGFFGELAEASNVPGLEGQLRTHLSERFEDPAQNEEILDLMVGRAFRASLFVCAEELPEVRETIHETITDELFFRAQLRPEDKRFSLDRDVAESFVAPGNDAKLSARSHVLKATLFELGRAYPRALSFGQVIERANLLLELRRVHAAGEQLSDDDIAGLRRDLLELCRLAHVEMALREPPFVADAGTTPRVSALTRLEAERDGFATSPRHTIVPLHAFARRLVSHLDGTRERAELIARMRVHVQSGDVVIHKDPETKLEGEELERALPELVENGIGELAAAGLLTG